MGGIVSTLAFPVPPKNYSAHLLIERSRNLVSLRTKSGLKVPAIFIKLPTTTTTSTTTKSKQPKSQSIIPTIIYSHGNAEDVGMSMYYLDRLAQDCQCHIFAYEYPGYSLAEGIPSEQNCYEAIQSAYEYMTQEMKIPKSSIIVFGRSLGTGPTIDIASKTKGLGGCILQSPLESGIRAVVGTAASYALYPIDIFRNYEKIHTVDCPVFIMHGMKDKVVPCDNGRALYKLLQQRQCHSNIEYKPQWFPNAGHNDIPEEECFQSCQKFVQFCRTRMM